MKENITADAENVVGKCKTLNQILFEEVYNDKMWKWYNEWG